MNVRRIVIFPMNTERMIVSSDIFFCEWRRVIVYGIAHMIDKGKAVSSVYATKERQQATQFECRSAAKFCKRRFAPTSKRI
jgi:hypothetical protein